MKKYSELLNQWAKEYKVAHSWGLVEADLFFVRDFVEWLDTQKPTVPQADDSTKQVLKNSKLLIEFIVKSCEDARKRGEQIDPSYLKYNCEDTYFELCHLLGEKR